MSNIKYTFTGKRAVVTGGALGIGFEITKKFLNAGAEVSIWDYDQQALENAQKELSDWKDQLQLVQVDVGDRNSCAKAAEKLSPFHVLVNNAGITRDRSFSKMSDEEFDAVIKTNLTGLYNVTKAVMEKFDPVKPHPGPSPKRIINLSSVVALYGNFGQTNYVAAKAGVIGMTKTWAKELGRKGFTVNAIAPGFTLTRMVQAMPEDVLKSMAEKVPVNRLGSTEDIANACLYLSTDEASYINGTVLSVDGGLVV